MIRYFPPVLLKEFSYDALPEEEKPMIERPGTILALSIILVIANSRN